MTSEAYRTCIWKGRESAKHLIRFLLHQTLLAVDLLQTPHVRDTVHPISPILTSIAVVSSTNNTDCHIVITCFIYSTILCASSCRISKLKPLSSLIVVRPHHVDRENSILQATNHLADNNTFNHVQLTPASITLLQLPFPASPEFQQPSRPPRFSLRQPRYGIPSKTTIHQGRASSGPDNLHLFASNYTPSSQLSLFI